MKNLLELAHENYVKESITVEMVEKFKWYWVQYKIDEVEMLLKFTVRF